MLKSLLKLVRAILVQLVTTILSRTAIVQNRWNERRYPDNDKLNLNPKDILGVILAAAAAVLCVAIDVILKEEDENTP